MQPSMSGSDDVMPTAEVVIPAGPRHLAGSLTVPRPSTGLVVFAHGSGSSRLSPRNQAVAGVLNGNALGTLLFDLLTDAEAAERDNVFDIGLLAGRLVHAVRWARARPALFGLPVGLFGASTGAAAALVAAAELGEDVQAVVSRGGRPDLAGDLLASVRCPTLLVVGGRDDVVLDLNERAATRLQCVHELVVVPGATHLFEEPGTLDAVARAATAFFIAHLRGAAGD